MAGATVSLGDSTVWPRVTTDGNGYYFIAGLPPGTYSVEFSLPDRPSQYAYGKTSSSTADRFTLAEGEDITVNDTLLPVGRIQGRLLHAGSEPVLDGWVTAIPTTTDLPTRTSATYYVGTYSMTVFPGDYLVRFATSFGEQYAYGSPDLSGAQVFSVAADQTVTVNDTLLETGPVTGRVVTSTGQPVAGAHVRATGVQEYEMWALTDESGHYSIPRLRPGDYRISVRLPSEAVMYAPQSRTWGGAGIYSLAAGEPATVDITLLPTGTVTGRFTVNGEGVGGVYVYLDGEFGFGGWAWTNADGEYLIESVFAERYKIRFMETSLTIDQWATGTVSQATADVFTVTAGTTLTINDARTPTGTLRIIARDALTGALVPQYWAVIGSFWRSNIDKRPTDDGVILVPDLLEGTYRVTVQAERFGDEQRDVKITAGHETKVELWLHPFGSVDVTVVDSATGAPVGGVDVTAFPPGRATAIVGESGYTDSGGKARLYLPAGSYNLLAWPYGLSSYGIQWVGPSAGTGDQREAAVVSVVSGRTGTAPTIRLDAAGAIAGKVTNPSGQPLRGGGVGVFTWAPTIDPWPELASTDKNGNYHLPGLGPYRWPLLLSADGYADQWSGGTASRYEAQQVQVVAGATATYNHVMQAGTAITGTIRDRDGTWPHGWLIAYNAETGDYAAKYHAPSRDPYRLLVMPGQQVKLSLPPHWLNGTSFETSGRIPVGADPIELDLCVTAASTLRARC